MKPGLHTVMVFDEADNCIGMAENVIAWNRREAYFTMMNRLAKHVTWDAWRDEDLERWPDDEPEPEYKIEFVAARLLALGRITEAPSDETVRRWCREGRFPNAYKKRAKGRGGSWCIPEADLVAFVKPRPGPKGARRKG